MTCTPIAAASTGAAAAEFSPAELLRNALEFHSAGHFDMARDLYEEVLAKEPGLAVAWHHLGLIAHARGNHAEAAELVGKATALQPNYAQAYSNLSAIFRALRNLPAAAETAERAIALDPNFAPAHSNFGSVREEQGDFGGALTAYRESCRIDPHFVEAHTNAADLLRKLKRHEEALAICDAIVDARPESARPYFCAGNILRELLRSGEAMAAFRQAIALQPRFAEAYCNLGNLLLRQGAFEEAIAAYQEAIAINPGFAPTYCNLGAAYEVAQRPADAMAAFAKAAALDPNMLGVEVQMYYQRRVACDWDGLGDIEATLLARVDAGRDPVPPFAILTMESSPATQLHVARCWSPSFYARPSFAHRRPDVGAETKRLKIGYLSSDFHRHATALLMAGLFERHDRARFEIIAYSYGLDDASEIRYRLGKAFDQFIDLRRLDDREAAQRVNADGVDILVELKGYTQSARCEIAAHRPAPIQVNFLGYPGTMGCDFIDYVIADPITLPMEQQPFYAEKIVHLPDCYQPNDRQRRVSDLTPSRTDCGLPDNGFVFCCFNNSYKLTPRFFSLWMRLLIAVPGSVLWLFDANPQIKANLAIEAAQRGVDPDRLVFAPRVRPPDHLVRQRLADLFLDCLPYNAHTTASDALWVGLPVITLIGETFAGRVAASLLNAVGLPELVTYSEAEYEALALTLATQPERLAGLRRRLRANRLTHPLFDTQRYTRHLEAAFTQMWENWAKGAPPQPYAVTPMPREIMQAEVVGTPANVGLPKISRTPYAACPLCGSTDQARLFVADGGAHPPYRPELETKIEWQACRVCGHVFAQGHFAAADLARPQSTRFGADIERGREAAAAIVGRIASHALQGAWLDVEFGTGALLLTAAEWGYLPIGIETCAENVAPLRQLGIEAHVGNFLNIDFKGRFSVVSLCDVLPRQPFPSQSLAAAHKLLRAGGMLFLSMPNRDSMIFSLLQAEAANPHWSEISHFHMFGRNRLYRLLRDCGFEPIDYQISAAHRVGMDVIARKFG